MSKSETQNFQMIHIASEFVALIGITFYFTSKHNSVMSEIKTLQTVIQKQQTTLSQYDKKINDLSKLIEKLQTRINNPPPPEHFGPIGHMGSPMGGQMGGMFEDPADVIGQMMSGGMGASLFTGRPTAPRSGGHNIHVMPDESPKAAKSNKNQSDGDETDSQLDAQLFDELAELGPSADNATIRHDELPTPQANSQMLAPASESSLNDDRSNNNSALSINDAGDNSN